MAAEKEKNHKAIQTDKARVIFFDLEYYVPKKNRKPHGLNYNPAVAGNMLLGGVFYSANPVSDLAPSGHSQMKKMKSFWLWQHKTEQQLLRAIYEYLKQIKGEVFKHLGDRVSPVMCGIGISNSDLPVLNHLFNKHLTDTSDKLFEFQNSFRVIDLSQLAIAAFNHNGPFLYPKTKNEVTSKFLSGKRMEDGRSVWELYEREEFGKIEARVIEEISLTISCYKAIKENFDLFKQLELKHKKELKKSDASRPNSINNLSSKADIL